MLSHLNPYGNDNRNSGPIDLGQQVSTRMHPLVFISEHFAPSRVKKPINLHGTGQSFNLRAGKPATIMGFKWR